MQGAYHSKTIQNKIEHNTIQSQYNTKQHKHQTQLFTKFYDMDNIHLINFNSFISYAIVGTLQALACNN
jgi:hypothetical protein